MSSSDSSSEAEIVKPSKKGGDKSSKHHDYNSKHTKKQLDLSDSESDLDNEQSKKDNKAPEFYKEHYEGLEGHMLLQIQKGFKGDQRFKIDKRFAGDYDSKAKLSATILGGLSNSEATVLQNKIKHDAEARFNKKVNEIKVKKNDDEFDIQKEKDGALSVLAQIVPAAEVFFRPTNIDAKKDLVKSKYSL